MPRVIDVRSDEKRRADDELAEARRRLHITQTQVEMARRTAADAAAVAGRLQDEAKKLRGDLANAALRADHDRLAAELERNQKDQRLANHAVAQAAAAQTEAEQLDADLAAAVAAAQRTADAAATAYGDATRQEELFASWRAALAAPATKAAVDQAKTTQASDDYKAAKARLERVLGGADMLELYRQRASFAAYEAAATRNLLLDALEAAAEARFDSERLRSERMWAAWDLGRVVDTVQDAAELTVARQAAAAKVFTEQAQRDTAVEGRDPLKTQLKVVDQRARRARAVKAMALEKTLLDAERALREAERDEAAAVVDAIGGQPDTPAEEQPDAADERDATKQARQAVRDAEAALNAKVDDPDGGTAKVTPKALLDEYEVAVPGDLFADVLAFFDADMTVDTVKGLDPAGLLQQLKDAESKYADTEKADVRQRRAIALVDAFTESRRRRTAASAGAATAHRLLTIRGDR